jgi:hypothetical protein
MVADAHAGNATKFVVTINNRWKAVSKPTSLKPIDLASTELVCKTLKG